MQTLEELPWLFHYSGPLFVFLFPLFFFFNFSLAKRVAALVLFASMLSKKSGWHEARWIL